MKILNTGCVNLDVDFFIAIALSSSLANIKGLLNRTAKFFES